MGTSMYGPLNYLPLLGGEMTGPLGGTSILTGVVNVPFSSSLAFDASTGGHFRIQMTGNAQLGTPLNPADGQKITTEFVQDAYGGRLLSFGPAWIFGASIPVPALSATPDVADILAWIYNAPAGGWLCAGALFSFPV